MQQAYRAPTRNSEWRDPAKIDVFGRLFLAELNRGRARFGWSYAEHLKPGELQNSDERDKPLSAPLAEQRADADQNRGFLKAPVSSLLVYRDIPCKDVLAVVELTGPPDWDDGIETPMFDADFRLFRPCQIKGVLAHEQLPDALLRSIRAPGRFAQIRSELVPGLLQLLA